MDVRVLGQFEVWGSDGRRLSIGGGKQAMLLALLVVRRNGVVSIDQLVAAIGLDRQSVRSSRSG
jgi:DNA-binding SARP family transcriptional activator